MLDLRPEWLAGVRRLLDQYVPDAEVLAFGSRVNGSAHEGSDLDLLIRNPKTPERSHPRLNQLRTAFTESSLPILVDLLDWAVIPEDFRAEIRKGPVEVLQPGHRQD
jgi:predicted nucleotidyltransferase